MRILRPGDEFDRVSVRESIFLAGPTPRDENGTDWRPGAIDLFERHLTSDITLFVPAPFVDKYPEREQNYDCQIRWEDQALNFADVILFWVPRELNHMPAFTTNVEFGAWIKSGKVVYGRPDDAPKCGYLDWHARKNFVPIRETLNQTIMASITLLKMRKE